jgi:hypothetical protein
MQEKIANLLSNLLNVSSDSRVIESLSFFVYDSIKIIFLLFFMIFLISYLKTYVSQKRLRKALSKGKGISNIFASILGAITPFCSCSSIPFFMSFIKAGVPLGVAFSFLITSPLVNEYVAVIMFATFGWKITLAYVIVGILVGVISGMILGVMKLEKNIEKDFRVDNGKIKDQKFESQKQRVSYGILEASSIVKKLWVWILVGVGIGAIVHGFVPQEMIQGIISKTGFFGVPLAVALGVPMYANCAAIIPIALVLFEKGVPLGTALAFMMAISDLSLPEAIMLRRAMNLKLISIFFGVVALSIVVIGYLFNLFAMFL